MTRFALLGSPFLGPEVWQPVAAELAGRGHRVIVVAPHGETPEQVALQLLDALPGISEDPAGPVLVPHSNAGLYVASIAAARPVRGVVFVDAALPGPGRVTPVAPPDLLAALVARADADGLLPPWTRWWTEAEIGPLFPDDATRRSVEAGQPRVPAGYLSGRVPTPAGWQTLPAGYLAFGDSYASETGLARTWGWPVRVLEGGHLHQLVDPVGVATAVLDLAARSGAAPD